MSSVSVRFNSFSFLYSIFNEQQVLFLHSTFASLSFHHRGIFSDSEFRTASVETRLRRVVGLDGFEPSTSRLSGARSNHLSYRPFLIWFRFVHLTLYLSSDPFRQIRLWVADLSSAGGDDGNRTHDPLLAGQVLSQLSYTPIPPKVVRRPVTEN